MASWAIPAACFYIKAAAPALRSMISKSKLTALNRSHTSDLSSSRGHCPVSPAGAEMGQEHILSMDSVKVLTISVQALLTAGLHPYTLDKTKK